MRVVTTDIGRESSRPDWGPATPDGVPSAQFVVAVLVVPPNGDVAHATTAVADAIRQALAGTPEPHSMPPAADTWSRRSLASIRQWMLDNLAQSITLDDLAQRAHLSRRQFTRDFRSETGTSPGRWLLMQRLQRATRLLETGDLPVERIAAATGFPSSAAFRAHFKRHAGRTPSAHRARHRNPAAAARAAA